MPTQEERLTTLEQSTAAHIKETSENLAMTIGLVQVQAFDIKKFSQRLDDIHESLQNTLSIHMEANNAHFEHLQKQVDTIQTTLAQILTRLPETP